MLMYLLQVVALIYVAHWVACGFYYLGRKQDRSVTWIDDLDTEGEDGLTRLYGVYAC